MRVEVFVARPMYTNGMLTRQPLGPLSENDVRYIRRHYLPLADLCAHSGVEAGWAADQIRMRRLPLPSYALADGTPMFPRDYFSLLESAGSAELVGRLFVVRYETAAAMAGHLEPGKAEEELQGYLDGLYGVCLWQATPENVFLKERLVLELEALLGDPAPDDPQWRQRVRTGVRSLDALARPFTECDRVRFGRPPSRERLIETPRRVYSWLRE